MDTELRAFEARKLFHAAALEEYKTLRAELVAMSVEQHKVSALVMAALPLTALASGYVNGKSFVIPVSVIALMSVGYSVLVLYMLHNYHLVIAIARYQKAVLLPAIQKNLREIGGTECKQLLQPMRWEIVNARFLEEPTLTNVAPFLVGVYPAFALAVWSTVQLAKSWAFDGSTYGKAALILLAWGALICACSLCLGQGARTRRYQAETAVEEEADKPVDPASALTSPGSSDLSI